MSRPHRQLLVIDADISIREDVVAHLKKNDFDVHQFSSGKEALLWLDANRPDAISADLFVSDMDGLQVLEALRKKLPQIPVIVTSDSGAVKDVVDVLHLGAADYLVKPIANIEVLLHAIERALERSELILQNQVYRQELEQANSELTEYIRLLERDQKAGRSVQRKLLPEAPVSFGDFNVDFQLIPSLYLSGDFIDFGCISKRYLAFYLVDVSGHGAASAFVTVWLKQLVHHFFREENAFRSEESFEKDAAKILSLVNMEVINSGVGCHMTCFVGVIDIYSKEMRYVFGGHLPFPILITDKGCEYLTGKGKPVGIFPDASWQVYSTTLPDTFSLVVFSDGILEVLPGKELIEKEQHLLEVVANNTQDIGSLTQAFAIDSMSSVPDDIAILKIQAEIS